MTRVAESLSPADWEGRLERAEAALRGGGRVVLCEPSGPASKADMILAAEAATPDAINGLITHGHSLLYVLMSAERCERLGIAALARHDSDRWISAMATSIEAKIGVTTGISAADRARTIRVAADPASVADDLVQPGHVFPVAARPGGLLARAGRTEATIELLEMTGIFPVAASCELMTDDGRTMDLAEAIGFAAREEIPVLSVEDVLARRLQLQPLRLGEETRLESGRWGALIQTIVSATDDEVVHWVLRRPSASPSGVERIHVLQACPLGDVFDACPHGCGQRLIAAISDVQQSDRAMLLFLAPGVAGRAHPADTRLAAALTGQILRLLGADRARPVDPELAAHLLTADSRGADV